jgi:hypothetical protein
VQSAGRRSEGQRDARTSEVALVVTATLIEPRIHWVEPSVESLGRQAVEFARRIGMTLDPEQELVLESSLGVNENGRWQAFEVGYNAPRQNGKGEVLLARELFGAYELGEGFIVHSAHEFKTSERHFERMENLVRHCPELFARVKRTGSGRVIGFRYSHGDEALELDDGTVIWFRTRTKSGMRGFDDIGLLVLDESMILSEWAHGAMLPTVRASSAEHGPQLWYAGSAVDQEIHEHGIVWTRVRERGIEGDDEGLVYFEWSLDFEHPDEVPDEVASDPDEWRRVNWAIERGRVREEHMAREFRALGRRQFAVELLGVGDYPATDLSGDSVISMEHWSEIEDTDSVLVDPVCLAFDVSPDRRTSIAAAGMNERGQTHIELIHSRAGTGWVPERLADLYRAHEVIEVVCDGFGPSGAIANRVDEAGVKVRRLKSGEYADACGLFAGEVGERRVRHIGQEDLTTAVRGARTRPLVDRWAWSRSKSRTDPGPLIASTLALWSASDQSFGDLEIF